MTERYYQVAISDGTLTILQKKSATNHTSSITIHAGPLCEEVGRSAWRQSSENTAAYDHVNDMCHECRHRLHSAAGGDCYTLNREVR